MVEEWDEMGGPVVSTLGCLLIAFGLFFSRLYCKSDDEKEKNNLLLFAGILVCGGIVMMIYGIVLCVNGVLLATGEEYIWLYDLGGVVNILVGVGVCGYACYKGYKGEEDEIEDAVEKGITGLIFLSNGIVLCITGNI